MYRNITPGERLWYIVEESVDEKSASGTIGIGANGSLLTEPSRTDLNGAGSLIAAHSPTSIILIPYYVYAKG